MRCVLAVLVVAIPAAYAAKTTSGLPALKDDLAAERTAREAGDAATLAAAKQYCDERVRSQGPQVFDSAGAHLGTLIDIVLEPDPAYPRHLTVTYRIMFDDGAIWTVYYKPFLVAPAWYQGVDADVAWDSPDCAGDPKYLVPFRGEAGLPVGMVVGNGSWNFVVTERRSSPSSGYYSFRTWGPDGLTCVKQQAWQALLLIEVDRVAIDPALCLPEWVEPCSARLPFHTRQP